MMIRKQTPDASSDPLESFLSRVDQLPWLAGVQTEVTKPTCPELSLHLFQSCIQCHTIKMRTRHVGHMRECLPHENTLLDLIPSITNNWV